MRRGVAAALVCAALGAGALYVGAARRGTETETHTGTHAGTGTGTGQGGIEPELEKALLAADKGAATDADALEAARLIEAAIRKDPSRSLQVARMLGRLENRALAFRLALVVGREVHGKEMRAVLLDAVRAGASHAREVAPYAFYGVKGDAEVAGALAEGFLDAKASPRVRAAQGFAVEGMLMELPEAARAAVRAEARRLAADPKTERELRVEAVPLLDLRGEDRDRARGLLNEDADRAVALSAARVLLRTGEDEKAVRGALLRFVDGAPKDDMTARSLGELLRGPGGGVQ